MSEQEVEAPVAVFRHCITVYEEMYSQAKVVQAEDSRMLVYEGKLVDLVTNTCGLAVPYYSKVTQALKGMGCCVQLRRGGSSTPSQWEIVQEPTVELYDAWVASQSEPEEVPEYPTMQQFLDLHRRVQTIERALGI